MEKRKMAKVLVLTAALTGGLTLGQSFFSEAQTSTTCRWMQVNLNCGNRYIGAETCVQGGNGNTCSCGSQTRNC